MTDKIVIFCTADSSEVASRIARSLVEKRLAACVNLIPGMRSVYRWKDAIEDAEELLLMIKTSRENLHAVRTEIEKLHSYEVPEVIALPIVDGSEAYLLWLDTELRTQETR
jgi:periplasmic divalent cation tolerance protein